MAGSFVRVTLRDGSTYQVVIPDGATAEGIVEAASKGQAWHGGTGWVDVEPGGAVARRLVAAAQIVQIELFERPG